MQFSIIANILIVKPKTIHFDARIKNKTQKVGDREFKFAGDCCNCSRHTFYSKEISEQYWSEPDPRSEVTAFHAACSLEARAFRLTGKDVVFCWFCVNDNKVIYNRCLSIAKNHWQ